MVRMTVAFLTSLYAIGFAFAAFTAVRWPSLIAAGALFGDDASTLNQIQGLMNWRELGIHIGAPYILAAFLFYTSATLIARKAHGAVTWFVMAVGVGFPPFILFDFAPGWWMAPDSFEQGVILVAVFTLFLFSMVWELRAKRGDKAKRVAQGIPAQQVPQAPVQHAPEPIVVYAQPAMLQAPKVKPVRRRPVSPAIARQRACFAEYGRKAAMARQGR